MKNATNISALAEFICVYLTDTAPQILKEHQWLMLAGGFTNGQLVKVVEHTGVRERPALFSTHEEADTIDLATILLRMKEFASRAAGGSISAFLCRRETTDRHYQRRQLTTTFIKQLITTNNLIHKHVTSGRSNPQLHAQCIPHSTLLLPPAGTPVHSTHAAWTPSHTCSLAGFSLTVFNIIHNFPQLALSHMAYVNPF